MGVGWYDGCVDHCVYSNRTIDDERRFESKEQALLLNISNG